MWLGNRMNLDIRPMKDGDSHHLINIDLKSSEFPFQFEDWQLLAHYFPDWKIMVGCLDETPVSFAIVEFEHDDEMVVRIHRIVAMPEGKKFGVHNAILYTIEYEATIAGFAKIQIPVPTSSCRGPEDPYDMSEWLKENKYRCVEIEEDMFEAYGETIEGYIFEKSCLEVATNEQK